MRPDELLVDGTVEDRIYRKVLATEALLGQIGERDALRGHLELNEQQLRRVLVHEGARALQRKSDAVHAAARVDVRRVQVVDVAR